MNIKNELFNLVHMHANEQTSHFLFRGACFINLPIIYVNNELE